MTLIHLRFMAALLTVTGIFVASNIYTFIPIYRQVAQSLLVSEKQAVLAGSLFTLFYAIGLLCFGLLSNIYGKRNILVWGMFCAAVATLMIGLSTSIHFLYFARSLQGFTLGSFAPMAFAYTFDFFQGKNRTLLLVYINTGYLIAGIFGQICSSYISIEFGWRNVFFFFSFSYFLFFALSFFTLPVSRNTLKQQKLTLAEVTRLLKVKGLVKSYIITFSLLFSSVAFYDTLERSFEDSQYLRIIGLFGAILSLYTGRLIERWKTAGTLKLGLMIGISSILFMLFFHKELMYIITILFISSIALLIPTIVTRIGTITGEHRVIALSLYSFILLIGASFAPLLVVFLSFTQVLIVLLSFYLLNLFLISQK
jgi:predicted MFS family arabinose efflux permease